jgi:catechol 2,3-dioxygenase-like lactoylglutathione lyase family enzyme
MSPAIEQLVKRYEGGGMTRRELVLALSALVMARPAGGAAAQQGAAPAPIRVSTMNHVTLTVSDVQRSVEFYQRVLGLPLVTTQGTERDWDAPAVPVLGIGEGPQFIAFSQGDRPHINHYCLGMEGFDAAEVVARLAEHGIEARVRMRADSDPPAEELIFPDPDGIPVQIQDVSYCGGSGKLGDLCDPDDRPRVR